MTIPARIRYTGYRFPAEIISHAVWLYFRFPLGLRMVEESKFPANRENTGNFIDLDLGDASTVAKNAVQSVRYEQIPYAS